MDAVGPTSLVLQCVEGLNAAIRNVQGAPEQVQNLQNDLGALSPALKRLDQESRNASSGVVMTNEMKNVLDNTGNACQNFQDSLAHWTRHSTAEKIRIFDRLSIGLLKQEQITSLKGVLDGCKSTLTVTLSTAI